MVLKTEQSVVIPLLKTFSAEKIKLQYKALESERVRTDIYFFEHKFAVEIDEKGHADRNQDKENERQTKIEKHSDGKFLTGLILMQRVLTFLLKLVKHKTTLLNQMKKK